jgi:hypothetical protein
MDELHLLETSLSIDIEGLSGVVEEIASDTDAILDGLGAPPDLGPITAELDALTADVSEWGDLIRATFKAVVNINSSPAITNWDNPLLSGWYFDTVLDDYRGIEMPKFTPESREEGEDAFTWISRILEGPVEYRVSWFGAGVPPNDIVKIQWHAITELEHRQELSLLYCGDFTGGVRGACQLPIWKYTPSSGPPERKVMDDIVFFTGMIPFVAEPG